MLYASDDARNTPSGSDSHRDPELEPVLRGATFRLRNIRSSHAATAPRVEPHVYSLLLPAGATMPLSARVAAPGLPDAAYGDPR